MSHLNEELRLALRREEPPAGFAERVLERLPAAPPRVVRTPARGRTAPRFALAAAAALAVATGSILLAIPRGPISEQRAVVPPGPTAPTGGDQQTVHLFGYQPPPAPPRPASRHARPVRPAAPRQDPDAAAIRAAEQLRVALHITGDKLNVARREVRETLTVPES